MDVTTGLLGLSTCLDSMVSQELITSEIPLPDGRDVSEVLCVFARASVDRCECGDESVRVTGNLTLYCVCRSMLDEVFGFQAQSAFTESVAISGVMNGHLAEARAQILECKASPASDRLKMSAVLELAVTVTAPVTTPFVTDIAGCASLEKRCMTLTNARCAQLSEATLRLSEETDAGGVLRVLVCHGAAQVASVSFTGAATCEAAGKLIVSLLVETEDHEVRTQILNLPFHCSFDAPYQSDAWAECTVESMSAVAADVSFGVIDVNAVLHIRLYGTESTEVRALCDAYADKEAFACRTASLDQLQYLSTEQRTCTIVENVQIPKPLPDAMRAVYATAMPVVTGLFAKDGRLGADIMLLTTVLYRSDEGRLYAFTEDIPAQLPFDAPFTPDARVYVRMLSVVASGGGRAPELTFTLEGRATLCKTERITLVTELIEEEDPVPYSGILIYCADAGEALWDVGKRFRIPLARIREWNGALSEPLAEGQAVVLMK